MYKGLVDKGGLIAFHDIVSSECHHNLNCYVDKLWNEIKNDYQHIEFIQNPKQHKYGIGVLRTWQLLNYKWKLIKEALLVVVYPYILASYFQKTNFRRWKIK